ncbi:hypothetical protein QOZ80_1AG0018550 [Eleusine coracana subsp. coracana]|nr:hypothetical protein QOZ80_1AG0018550 [Eleusine coracana subsp. coracana]
MGREKEVVLVVCGEESEAAPMFDINTGQEIPYVHDCLAPPSGLVDIAGRLLAASRSDKKQPIFGGAIHFWDLNKLQGSHKSCIGEAVGPIACSKDGVYLVVGAHSGNAYIWEVASGALLKTWRAHKNAISCLCFSQDSSLVISGSEDGKVHVWCMISLFQAEETQAHEVIKSRPNFYYTIEHGASITGILTILGAPCPILITSSLDGYCKVTELMSGRLLCVLALSSPISTIAIDHFEQLLVCGACDAAIYITGLYGIRMQQSALNVSKDDCQVLYGHKSPVSALAFNPEGVCMVSGSKDYTVFIWNTTTWNIVRKLDNKIGPVTNLLVIPMPSTFRTRNSLAPEIPTLEKIIKPAEDTAVFMQSSGFKDDGDSNSMRACFQSYSFLNKQILDLEENRTPEAIEMSVGMIVDEQIKNQGLAKELGEMNSVLQWKTLNMMELPRDGENDQLFVAKHVDMEKNALDAGSLKAASRQHFDTMWLMF